MLHGEDLNINSQISSPVAYERVNAEVKTFALLIGFGIAAKTLIDKLADRTTSWLRLVLIMAYVLRPIRRRAPDEISLCLK